MLLAKEPNEVIEWKLMLAESKTAMVIYRCRRHSNQLLRRASRHDIESNFRVR